MPQPIQHRRDTSANWTAANTVLQSGQWGVETDTGRLKLGVAAGTAWNSLPYAGLSPAFRTLPMREPVGGHVIIPGTTQVTALGSASTGLAALDSSVVTLRVPDGSSRLSYIPRVAWVGPTAAVSRNAGCNTLLANSPLRAPDASFIGGFYFRAAAAISDANSAGQFAIGLNTQTPVWTTAAHPSAGFNQIILGADGGDTTMSIMHNGASGASTKIALGASFPNNTNFIDGYELFIDFHSNGFVRTLLWAATNLRTDVTVTGSIPDTAKMPVSGTQMALVAERGSAGNAVAPSIEFFGDQFGSLA